MKKVIQTNNAPAAIGPYSQGIVVGDLIFVSGQTPINPADGSIPEDVEAQVHQCFKNLKAILEAAGSSLDKAVKCTVFMKNMDDFVKVNGIYQQYFNGDFPTRSAVEVARLPKDVLVEIEAIETL